MNMKIDEFKQKIVWFVIPLLVTFFTWVVITLSSIQTEVAVVKTTGIERNDIQEKTWNLVQSNNTILNEKADQKTNDYEHKQLLAGQTELTKKVTNIEFQISKVYNRQLYSQLYSYENSKDTSFINTIKTNSILTNQVVAQKVIVKDTIQFKVDLFPIEPKIPSVSWVLANKNINPNR